MTPEQARARLGRMVAADVDPALTEPELDDLMTIAARPDTDGRNPSDAGWAPTYALGAAAAEGWTWKAGKASARVDFAGDDTRVSRSQLVAHCMAMADRYRRQGLSSVSLTAGTSRAIATAIALGHAALLPGAQGPFHAGPPYVSPLALPGARSRGDSAA